MCTMSVCGFVYMCRCLGVFVCMCACVHVCMCAGVSFVRSQFVRPNPFRGIRMDDYVGPKSFDSLVESVGSILQFSENDHGHHSSTSAAAVSKNPGDNNKSFDSLIIGDPMPETESVGSIVQYSENDHGHHSRTSAAAVFKKLRDQSLSRTFNSSDGGVSNNFSEEALSCLLGLTAPSGGTTAEQTSDAGMVIDHQHSKNPTDPSRVATAASEQHDGGIVVHDQHSKNPSSPSRGTTAAAEQHDAGMVLHHQHSERPQVGASATTLKHLDSTAANLQPITPTHPQSTRQHSHEQQHCQQIQRQQQQLAATLANRVGHGVTLPTECRHCGRCGESTLHTINKFSLHCRDKSNINKTYTSATCKQCGTESSVCPNHAEGVFFHPISNNTRLVWRRFSSKHTSEKVWEIACQACVNERLHRKTTKEHSPKLVKLTTKWTRCNHCLALYKKGKGVKGVHASNKCRVRPRVLHLHPSSPAAASPRAHTPSPAPPTIHHVHPPPAQLHTPSSTPPTIHHMHPPPAQQHNPNIELIKRLLADNTFTTLPEELRKRVGAQCSVHRE